MLAVQRRVDIGAGAKAGEGAIAGAGAMAACRTVFPVRLTVSYVVAGCVLLLAISFFFQFAGSLRLATAGNCVRRGLDVARVGRGAITCEPSVADPAGTGFCAGALWGRAAPPATAAWSIAGRVLVVVDDRVNSANGVMGALLRANSLDDFINHQPPITQPASPATVANCITPSCPIRRREASLLEAATVGVMGRGCEIAALVARLK